MVVLGPSKLRVIHDVARSCASNLPFTRQLDLIRILILAVETFNFDCISVLQVALGAILEKAMQTPAPKSNISDEDRAIVETNSYFVKLLCDCVEKLGPIFVFNATFAPMITPIVSWLVNVQILSPLDKKN